MKKYSHYLFDTFESMGMTHSGAKLLNMFSLLLILLVTSILLDYLAKISIRKISAGIAFRSKTKFDDILITNKLPRNFAHIIPVVFFKFYVPIIFVDYVKTGILVNKAVSIFAIILTLWIVRSVLNSVKDYLKSKPKYQDKPIDSYIQVFMIFAWFAGFMFSFTVLTDITVWKFLTAMGAVSAIILLIFRDTILGFVASIQVSINDMVRIGDWITFDKYGADGDVTEINLATVKVQNFDNTITTIPTYALISDSFKNWRGMHNSDGRRIKRSLYIRQDTIKYLTATDIDKLKNVEILAPYLTNKLIEIENYNTKYATDKSLLLNGRNLTNIGVFRKYIELFLHNHSAINKDMMIMARQLQQTNHGIPIEVYAFSKDKRWENYEYISSDIFDHLLAAIKYFDLDIFESPNNKSFK